MNSFLEVSIPMDYKNTIITPKTDFPMKAGLPTREPGMLSRWEEQDLYEAMLEKNKDLPPFVLHDGPPFSNGDIHMGHALNKTLKDFIVRSHAMMGYYTPYVPGWDNHGLPIETAIIKKSKLNHKAMPVPQFRAACEEFAETYIQRQMAGFKRLGVVGNWKHPYRTMDKHFEAQEVKVFGRMFDKGYIYKGLKPVYWCPVCATAVAEAEIEYHDDPCTSVYVKFPMKDDLGKLAGFDLSRTYFVIWTTTIWTLPGNLAICLHPRETYVLVKAENGETYIMAQALMDKGYTVCTNGTDNHLILWDVRPLGLTGSKIEKLCDRINISLNKNTVHGDKSAQSPGGVRIGTPALTTRGLKEADFVKVAGFLDRAVKIALDVQKVSGKKLKDYVGEPVKIHNLWDDFLANNPNEIGEFTIENRCRLYNDIKSAEMTGADMIVVTCSTLTPVVNMIRPFVRVPLIAIDDAMGRKAVTYGDRILVLATAGSTEGPMREKLNAEAA